MKHILKAILITGLLINSSHSLAVTDCNQKVSRVWNDLSPGKFVWIFFEGDGAAPAKILEGDISEGQMGRLFAQLLTAVTTNIPVTVRYAADGLSCPPTGPVRDDVQGIMINSATAVESASLIKQIDGL